MSDDLIQLGEAQTLRVIASTPDALELESTWTGTNRKPPRHYHPHQDERFEILEGELTIELSREPATVLRAGDTLEVPHGTVHRMWNAGTETTRGTWLVTPGMRTEEMFRYLDRGMSPLRTVRMLWTFRREFRLSLR